MGSRHAVGLTEGLASGSMLQGSNADGFVCMPGRPRDGAAAEAAVLRVPDSAAARRPLGSATHTEEAAARRFRPGPGSYLRYPPPRTATDQQDAPGSDIGANVPVVSLGYGTGVGRRVLFGSRPEVEVPSAFLDPLSASVAPPAVSLLRLPGSVPLEPSAPPGGEAVAHSGTDSRTWGERKSVR